MLEAGSPIQVRKLRPDRSQAYAWTGQVMRCDEVEIVVRAEFNRDLVDLGYTTFRRGDIFHEFYYWDGQPTRYYNVFQISSPAGEVKGWYCNLGLPPELDAEAQEMSYVDLALDVWAYPNGDFLVLDEDELDVLLAQHPEFAAAAEQGRADLLRLAQSRQMPRWP